ncbi:uncharacterized protein V6R79_022670 [Siganus canaliculatus]
MAYHSLRNRVRRLLDLNGLWSQPKGTKQRDNQVSGTERWNRENRENRENRGENGGVRSTAGNEAELSGTTAKKNRLFVERWKKIGHWTGSPRGRLQGPDRRHGSGLAPVQAPV